MWRTLIYYKPEQIDLAKKLRDDYIAHQKEIFHSLHGSFIFGSLSS